MVSTKIKAKVLVVDDEPSILASISDLLESEFDVTTTTDPRRGLDNLTTKEISVLISDQRMPDMNGDEFLHRARETSSATRVLLTGFADIEALVRAVNEGKIYAYVSKPWDPLALRTTIRNAASEYRLLDVLRSERNLLRTLVDNIPDCVYVQDLAQRYTLVNRAFAKLAGMTDPAEAVGKTELECLPGAFGRIAAEDGRKIVQSGSPLIAKCDVWQKDAEEARWYSTTRVPIRSPIDHRIEALVGVSIDVTEQKQIEKHLTEAKQTAEKTVRAKEEFLARISHEIRTPLNCILGMAQLLAETDLSQQQGTYAGMLRSNSEMLLRLMNDLIDLTRGDLNELRLAAAEFSPREVVNAVVESLEKDAASKGIGLRLELGNGIPSLVIGDAGRLKQILNNLVNNALKFTPHGEILVKLQGAPLEKQAVLLEFAVEDSGIGIAADKLDEIFEPFSQAEEFITGLYGGSGLGLTICRQLVQQMGGAIWVQSSPGAGSIFRFTARLRVAGTQSPARAVSRQSNFTQSSFAGLRVLLAEDNEDNVFLVEAYLGAPVKMEIASNGREAVDKFMAGQFDIVLMDLRMPVMDGLQATRLIREWEQVHRKPPTPILACTAHADIQDASLEAGCTGHLVKPVSQEALFAALAKYATVII
jgi:PAS domain S-box-containing protein